MVILLKCGQGFGVLQSIAIAKKSFICGIRVEENETYTISKLHVEHESYVKGLAEYRIWDNYGGKGLLSFEIANSNEYFEEITG
jgi:hypothetical protein